MYNIFRSKKRISEIFLMVSMFVVSISLISCEKFELPEANSKADDTPPVANFSYSQGGADEFLVYTFANLSSSATTYSWDFGDGNTSTGLDVENTYPDEGTYTITLTASDALGVESVFSETIEVVQPPEPAAITPEILNGNFDDGQDNWKIANFTGGTTNPYNSSSDGDPLNYDGSPSGETKTPGAKWTSSTSAGPSLSSSTRYAYQAITVTPNTEYVIQYSHAIKTDVADIDGGDRVIVEILDGWFDDGVDAVASSNGGPLVQTIGNVANGKGDFTVITESFTSNATGEVSIWMYAITADELYVDNVKVVPVDQ